MSAYLISVVYWFVEISESIGSIKLESRIIRFSYSLNEIPFIVQALLLMGIKTKLPVTDEVDNMGAVYRTESLDFSARTRHMDS